MWFACRLVVEVFIEGRNETHPESFQWTVMLHMWFSYEMHSACVVLCRNDMEWHTTLEWKLETSERFRLIQCNAVFILFCGKLSFSLFEIILHGRFYKFRRCVRPSSIFIWLTIKLYSRKSFVRELFPDVRVPARGSTVSLDLNESLRYNLKITDKSLCSDGLFIASSPFPAI